MTNQLQVIVQYMEQVEAVANAIEAHGYIVPEILEWALDVKDLDSISMDELAGVIVSYEGTGELGNAFDSEIIAKDYMGDIAESTLRESGIDALANLMAGYTWFGSEYVIYNSLGHFEDLTWGHCLNEWETILELIVNDHLEALRADYVPDLVNELLLSVGNLTELYFEVSMNLLTMGLDVEFYNANDERLALIQVDFEEELENVGDGLEADSETAIFKVYAKGCEAVFNYPKQSDALRIADAIL